MTKILFGAALPALLALGTMHDARAQTVPRIVFQAPVTVNRKATYSQIFAMNPDGSGVVQLTSANANSYGPRWSPGQRYIAFGRIAAGAPGDQGWLYVMEAKGEAHRGRTFAVAHANQCGGSDWSPDGKELVYEGPIGNLYIVPVDLAKGKAGTPVLFRSGKYSSPSWSPDGTRIAFWGCDDGNLPFFIKVRDVASGAEISFGVSDPAATRFGNQTPQWSPDGSLIAFAGPAEGTTGTACEIFIANADGSDIRRVTYLKSYTFYPTWSPDLTTPTIAFRSDVSGTPSVYKMVLDSNVTTLLHSLANAPDWNP